MVFEELLLHLALGLQPFRFTVSGCALPCVRDGSPKGREGRPSLALGPLGGKIAALGRNFMPREPAPAQQGTPLRK